MQPTLTDEELEEHPYMDSPPLHLLCTYCGAAHCSPESTDHDLPACRRLDYHLKYAKSRESCHYLRCHEKKTHMTRACPALHARCPVCACRGPGRDDDCDTSDSNVMEALRSDFELYAGKGALTSRRRKPGQAAWGWYPLNRSSAATSYSYLARLGAVEALRVVQELGALTPADIR